jgi:hypothetical protein
MTMPTVRNIREHLQPLNSAAPKGTATTLNAVDPQERLSCSWRPARRGTVAQAGLVEFHAPVEVQYRYGAITEAAREQCRALWRPVVRCWRNRKNYVVLAKVR